MIRQLIYILCLTLGVSACGTSKKSQEETSTVKITFNADSAYLYCQQQCDFGPRTMNSDAHELCAKWMEEKFTQYGYRVTLQKTDLKGYDGTLLQSTNIIAQSPVATEAAASRILICAHWDSRPWADNDPDSTNWHKPVMAANDGASGVAVMLELARLLQQNDSMKVAVDFICFDAEDWGVPQWSQVSSENSWALGSQYWAAHPAPLNPKSYQYGILLDMVGGQGAKFYQEGFSLQHARSVVNKIWNAASAAGYGSFFPAETGGYVTDDHVPINEVAGIPCADIINHYPDCPQSSFGTTWHTVQDDMQHIDRNTLQAVGQTLVQVLFAE